ncbi:hypothetical protein QYE76_002248 [Lolium multiflorum]|uniref:Uncharacterized protein n=1 Tax=Lolium multiflorum TaxID=4521 RepID=A0AAD8W035_LOLMU|nr:hypothetical protein QYE76_002248 [Lolium multiflorum]
MVKKKNRAAASSTSGGAAAKASSNLPKRSTPDAPPPAPTPPAKFGGRAQTRRLASIPIVSENLHDLPNDTSEGRGSSAPVDFHTAEYMSSKNEHDDPMNSEAIFTDLPPPANDTCDTARSVRDDDADHDAFVNAAVEEARASPAKRSTGGFADEDDLLDLLRLRRPNLAPFYRMSQLPKLRLLLQPPRPKYRLLPPFLGEGYSFDCCRHDPSFRKTCLRLPIYFPGIRLQKEVKSSSSKLDGAVKIAAAARQEVDSLKEELSKLKEKLKEEEASRLAEAWAAEKMIFFASLPWLCLVFPVPAFVDDSSGALSEGDRIQRMKDRIAQMEKDLRNTYALAAIIKKKGEIAADVERYALTELHKATEIIALNRAEENKRIHERVNTLTSVIMMRFLEGALESFGCRAVPRSGPAGPPLLRQVLQRPKSNLEDDVPFERDPSYTIVSDV